MLHSQRSQEYSPSRPVETRAALAQLWQAASQPTEALSHIRLTGAEPVLPSSFAVGTAAQASIAASALAAASQIAKTSNPQNNPALLGWVSDYGQPGNVLANTPNWAASLGTPQTNAQGQGQNFNQREQQWN